MKMRLADRLRLMFVVALLLLCALILETCYRWVDRLEAQKKALARKPLDQFVAQLCKERGLSLED